MITKLQPNRVRRTYLGGGRIDAFCGVSRDVSDGVPRPEDWLASTTTAFNGTLEIDGEGLGRFEDGRLVKDVVGSLPILVKLLDSDERLVIQAHPTLPCAKRLFTSSVGKTECWYFLPGTATDACVYLGFKPGITREKWRAAFGSQQGLLDMLHCVPVAPGDFVFVDGGVPHAIGAGCFMVELQEPSDLMVVAERFTPSGRRIPDAKMHGGVGWEKMFDVYEYEDLDFEEVCRRYVRRGSTCSTRLNIAPVTQICGPELTDKFSMWLIAESGHLELPRDRAVAVVTDGAGSVNGVDLKKGDRFVVYDGQDITTQGDVTIIACA